MTLLVSHTGVRGEAFGLGDCFRYSVVVVLALLFFTMDFSAGRSGCLEGSFLNLLRVLSLTCEFNLEYSLAQRFDFCRCHLQPILHLICCACLLQLGFNGHFAGLLDDTMACA